APNGSVMRTHPIGIIGIGLSEEETWKYAVAVEWTTHVDPRCSVAYCISTGLIRSIRRGEIVNEDDVDDVIERAYNFVASYPDILNPGSKSNPSYDEMGQLLNRDEFDAHLYAGSLADLKLDKVSKIGYVYKCIGSAVLLLRFCIRGAQVTIIPSKPLFEELITNLIMEGGDADTNGAVAGAIIGTYLGYANIPPHWALGLAHNDWFNWKILRLTKALEVIYGEIRRENDESIDGGRRQYSRESLGLADRATDGAFVEQVHQQNLLLSAS
ncbi:ADP-ribosylglycohydrolase, partial [Byssothecium circinans]